MAKKYSSQEVMDSTQAHIMNTYGREPLVIERGEGSFVWDVEGKKYLDFLTGISVLNLGHRPPAVMQSVQEQMEKLFHCSNLYYSIPSALLAEELTKLTFADQVFFCNSGAEANECAVKLARRYAAKNGKGEESAELICMNRSFHGRTLAMLSATGQEKVRKGFAPYMPGFRFVDFGDFEGLKKAVTLKTIGVLLEPIQGEGGVHVAPPGYLKQVRTLCDQQGLLLLFDEIQTSMGRTGRFCAYEAENVTPDMMTMAKSLGGGLPLGACLATKKVAEAFEPGSHASTFGANPVACAAGLAMVRGVSDPKLLENCRQRGAQLQEGLEEIAAKFDFVQKIRGRGLMLGLELRLEVKELMRGCIRQGVLVNMAGPQTLRFLPPLNVTPEQVKEGLTLLEKAFAEFKRDHVS